MAFVDFLNKTSEVIASNIDSLNKTIQETHRCLILDKDARLSSVYKRIESHFTRIVNSDILYVSDENVDDIDIKSFLGYSGRRIYLAVICYDVSILETFLNVLYKYLEHLKLKDGNITRYYIKLNLFYLFTIDENKENSANADAFKEESRKLCKVLSDTFKGDVNRFPDCSVVFKLFIENDDIEKIEFADEVFNLHINSDVQGEKVNALYVNYNEDVKKFTENTLPWVAYKIQESFIPEQIILRSLYNRFTRIINNDKFIDELDENNDKLVLKARKRMFDILGMNGYSQIEEEFRSSKEFFPVDSSEEEWENRKKTVKFTASDEPEKGLFGLFRKKKNKENENTTEKEVDDFKKAVFNDDEEISWNQYIFFVKDRISPKQMCSIVLDSLSSMNLSINERVFPKIRENVCNVITKVFSERKHPVWESLCKYYIENIDERILAEVYNENVKVCSKIQKVLDEQIKKWMRVSAAQGEMDFETMVLSSWNNEKIIIKDFINYIELKSKEESFKRELNNCCKQSAVVINSVNGFIPLTNDKNFKFVDYSSPADEDERAELEKKSYKKREVRFTRGNCPDDISL